MRSSTLTKRRRRLGIRRFTTSPPQCAKPPPRQGNQTTYICGQGLDTGTPPPSPQPTFCGGWHLTSDRPESESELEAVEQVVGAAGRRPRQRVYQPPRSRFDLLVAG